MINCFLGAMLLLLFCNTIVPVNKKEAKQIGMLIWQNEASQRIDLLAVWNKNETFPSLGIGHFIWFPKNQRPKFTEQFPLLCQYLKQHGITLPHWLERALRTGAPWSCREQFLQDNKKLDELRNLLASTIDLQINFIIDQFKQQVPGILEAAPEKYKSKVTYNINLMLSCPQGTYALVDYLNFKGNGLLQAEELKGQRWGLLQVLVEMSAMSDRLTSSNVNQAFAIAAAKILLRRIENSAPAYPLAQYLGGWIKRVGTYAIPEIM
jgi:hypothetical protein